MKKSTSEAKEIKLLKHYKNSRYRKGDIIELWLPFAFAALVILAIYLMFRNFSWY